MATPVSKHHVFSESEDVEDAGSNITGLWIFFIPSFLKLLIVHLSELKKP